MWGFEDYLQEVLWVCPDRTAVIDETSRLDYRQYADETWGEPFGQERMAYRSY